MSINNLNTYLNIKDSHLRVVSGNVYAQAMNIGGINVETAHGLQSVSNTGNVTSNTLQFSNAITGFVTTANAQIGRDLVVSGNTTVSTDLTVSANATVADTLTISEHLIASKEATITGNLHVTTIRSDSNVVTEYTGPHDRPLRKYPEVALTADAATASGYKGYFVSQASATLNGTSNRQAWAFFDNVLLEKTGHAGPHFDLSGDRYDTSGDYTGGDNLGGVSGDWVYIRLPNKIRLQSVDLWARVAGGRNPVDATVLGSLNGTNWSVVGSWTNANFTVGNSTSFTINSPQYYDYIGFVFEKIEANSSGQYINFHEIELYGHEEGSGSLDTTLKTVYNVPATTGTQLEVYYDAKNYTSGTITDESPNSYVGTLNDNTQLETVDGIKAFKFDGNADTITGTVSGASGEYVHTITFWVKFNDFSTANTGYTLFEMGTRSNDDMIGLYAEPGKVNYYFFSNDNSYSLNGVSSGNLIHDQWYHFTATYSGGSDLSNRKLYINGNEIPRSTHGGASSGALTLANGNFTIGDIIGGNGLNDFAGSIANFRLYSKALNADQIKELYDYQKDYFLGSKSQVTLYKGHLGVGVTEPSGQLELAGDERIQEYPPGPMSGYETLIPGHGVFCAYASTDFDDPGPYRSWNAFDKSISTVGGNNGWASVVNSWLNDGTTTPISSLAANFDGVECHWLALQLPYEVKPTLVTLRARNGSQTPPEVPAKGRIYGSKDGVTWNQIRSYNIRTEVGTLQASTDTAPISISLTTNEYYTHLLLTVDERYGGSGSATWTSIGELKFFGTPGPTTLDKGSLSLTRSLDVPRVSRYDVDTETPRPEKLVVDFDTTVNNSPTDISGQGNHGTMVGATYSSADKAFNYVGTSGNTIKTETGFSGNQSHTISLWFNPDVVDANQNMLVFISSDGGTDLGRSIIYFNTTQGTVFDFRSKRITSATLPVVGQWMHIVSTYNSSNGATKMYMNGVLKTDITEVNASTTINLVNGALAIGNNHNGNEQFDGKISNFKLYDVALEPSEVKKLYNLGRTGRSMVISDTAVGIGKVPEAQLDVRGNLNVDGVITNQQRPAFYVWRDGTGNNVEAIGHGGQSRLAVTGVITNWDSKRVDTAGTFDLSNGRYYIPVSGLYMLIGVGVYRYQSGTAVLEASFYVNGSNVGPRGISYNRGNTTSEHHTVTITFMRFMNVGDYVQMGVPVAQSACDLYYGDNLGYFSGYLLG